MDYEIGQNIWLTAFAQIRLITGGGFLAVSYLKNRDSTGDVDYLIDPEFAADKNLQNALHSTMRTVARQLQYDDELDQRSYGYLCAPKARQTLFKLAKKQNIALSLFKGESFKILAAPIEWALERKLMRIYAADRDREAEMDISDAIAFFEVPEGA
ncbi:uncharacterized protein N7479_005144 [Penicillium vulpinum]|uniref:uncharacterized protein n=1 Tax=Penicillium vulpinum TaxID=29845 RepID=UPI0025482D06|nr:uncharacterized protein N7479_005144 [Penicillium vulpinum]KAJ5957994.1 hypothetical protein N7479_005144 [Penicillium vulpinum]